MKRASATKKRKHSGGKTVTARRTSKMFRDHIAELMRGNNAVAFLDGDYDLKKAQRPCVRKPTDRGYYPPRQRGDVHIEKAKTPEATWVFDDWPTVNAPRLRVSHDGGYFEFEAAEPVRKKVTVRMPFKAFRALCHWGMPIACQ